MRVLDDVAPAYFHTLSDDEIDHIIADSRAIIFGEKPGDNKLAGVRLHWARIRQDERIQHLDNEAARFEYEQALM